MTESRFGDGFGEVAERLRRSTVQVEAKGWGPTQGSGSGVVWNRDGIILTNNHVARADRLQVQFWDGRSAQAEVISRQAARDLAVLRIGSGAAVPAEIGDSGALRPGELAVAVGNPLGFSGALSRGVVHGVGPVTGLGRRRWVQASIRLAPGNSGGPLANARGEVIGINTMVAGGLGLAIPSNEAAVLIAGGSAHPPMRLGVTLRAVRLKGGAAGLLLLEVQPGSAAERASLLQGDLLVAANETRLESVEDLQYALESGDATLRLTFLRGSGPSPRRVTVTNEGGRAAAA
jgi:serine protease Do